MTSFTVGQRLFVTGASGVIGAALLPLAEASGHEVRAPAHREVDLFDPASVGPAVSGCDAILHLATRIPPREQFDQPEAWRVGAVAPNLRSALVAERETARFAVAGRRGVVLRLGLLDGPGTGHDRPYDIYGTTLHVADAAAAVLTALTVPSGVYNVCRDGERVSNRRFAHATGWRPAH